MDLRRIVRPAFIMALAIAALPAASTVPVAAQAPADAAPMKPRSH